MRLFGSNNFFATCVTPLFFIETLADLEKEVRRGRTPEQVVGSLAYKTPDMKSHVSPFHTWMLLSELRGEQNIAMDARIRRSDGIVVQLNDQQGVIYRASKEEEAFVRWQRGEFLDLERQIAKEWRKAVSGIDYSQSYDSFKKLYGSFRRPKNLKDAKDIAETLIDLLDEEVSMRFGMTLLQVPSDVQSAAVARWSARGRQPLREFAPYFRHMYVVDLFYYLAIGADLISRVRPAREGGQQSGHCLPLLRSVLQGVRLKRQPSRARHSIVSSRRPNLCKGPVIKSGPEKLDEYFDALPEETKARGLHAFASYPPSEESFLVTRLWDQHSPNWRKEKAETPELSPELQKALLELTKRLSEQSKPIHGPGPVSIEDVQYIHMSRQVFRKKGKWTRLPPEAK